MLMCARARITTVGSARVGIHLVRRLYHSTVNVGKSNRISNDDRARVASSQKLHEALQQNLLSSTSSSSVTSKVKPSMTTTQLAMSKFGNETPTADAAVTSTTSSSTSGSSSSSSSIYVSVQERKRNNQQAIINVIFSFSVVILACQTFKSGVEKRRVQQQCSHAKETLQQTQAILQQYIYNRNNKKNQLHNDDVVSPEIQQIANLIVQQEFGNNHNRKGSNEAVPTKRATRSGWFTTTSSNSTLIDDECNDANVAVLLGSNDNIPTNSQTTSTLDEKNGDVSTEKRIAILIQQQLQLLLRDVAFDEYQKESLQVQALASTTASSAASEGKTSTVATTIGSSTDRFGHIANTDEDKKDDDGSMASLEQLLLESLQHENFTAAAAGTTTTPLPVVHTDTSTTDNSDTSNRVVKKRLFSI